MQAQLCDCFNIFQIYLIHVKASFPRTVMSLHSVAITIIVTLWGVAVDQSSTIVFIFFVVHLTIEHHILHIIVTSKFVLEAFVPGQ